MGYYINCILSFVIAFVVTFCTTPLVKKIAFKIGAVDIPKDDRRIHNKPIARLGGLAIFMGFLVSTLYLVISEFLDSGELILDYRFIGLMIGILIIVIIGIIDDIKQLKAWIKLVFQILAALVVIMSGVKIEEITNPFSSIGVTFLGMLSIPITVIWIVGITNAINFIDGVDGLAAGVSSIASLSLLFIAIFNQQQTDEVFLMAGLAGAALGFLPFNFNPAKIFMGDTGSTFLGFTLAVISIIGLVKMYAAIAIVIPLLALGLPIFDMTMTILRRMFNRGSIMQPDRGHIHHKLMEMGLTQRQTVVALYIISAVLGVCAIQLATNGVLKALILLAATAIFIIAGARYMDEIVKENQAKQEIQKSQNPDDISRLKGEMN